MDQGPSSVRAKMALSRDGETDIEYKLREIIFLSCICVKHHEGEIPGSLIHSPAMS